MRKVYSLTLTIIAFPFAVILILFGRLAILVDAFSEISIVASKIPFSLGRKIRYLYYKATLRSLGKEVIFQYGSFCQYPNVIIGDRVLFGYYNAIGEVEIGNDVIVGGFVNFVSGTSQHSFENKDLTIREQQAEGRKVIVIGSDVWIGSNCLIAANVGSRCVIGAGSILVKNAENNSIYAGNPAKLIKDIT